MDTPFGPSGIPCETGVWTGVRAETKIAWDLDYLDLKGINSVLPGFLGRPTSHGFVQLLGEEQPLSQRRRRGLRFAENSG
jgi:hypothetical protein